MHSKCNSTFNSHFILLQFSQIFQKFYFFVLRFFVVLSTLFCCHEFSIVDPHLRLQLGLEILEGYASAHVQGLTVDVL